MTDSVLPTVTFTGISDLAINGQAGDVALTVTTIAGFDQDTLTPGTAIDSGHVGITSDAAPVSETPLDFSNLGAGETRPLPTPAAPADTLIYDVQRPATRSIWTPPPARSPYRTPPPAWPRSRCSHRVCSTWS